MDTVLFVNATIGFSENLFLVLLLFYLRQTSQKAAIKKTMHCILRLSNPKLQKQNLYIPNFVKIYFPCLISF